MMLFVIISFLSGQGLRPRGGETDATTRGRLVRYKLSESYPAYSSGQSAILRVGMCKYSPGGAAAKSYPCKSCQARFLHRPLSGSPEIADFTEKRFTEPDSRKVSPCHRASERSAFVSPTPYRCEKLQALLDHTEQSPGGICGNACTTPAAKLHIA